MKIKYNIMSTQAKNCWFFIQIRYTGLFFGKSNKPGGYPKVYIELFTPRKNGCTGFDIEILGSEEVGEI